MVSKVLVHCFLLFLSISFTGLFAKSNLDDVRKICLELAQPTPSPILFYIWGEKKKMQGLLDHREFREQEFKKIYLENPVAVEGKHVAGAGIYMAEDPVSSSIYGSPLFCSNPNLVEVKVAKALPYLDLTNTRTMNALKSKGISEKDVYQANPQLLIKYDAINQWWIAKSGRGILFREPRFQQYSEEDLQRFSRKFRFLPPKYIFLNKKLKSNSFLLNETFEESVERNYWSECLRQEPEHVWDPFQKIVKKLVGHSLSYYSSEENSDGSISIHWPTYNYRGHFYGLDPSSSYAGLCKHYGYLGMKVEASVIVVGKIRFWHTKQVIKIDELGKPTALDNGKYSITTLKCLRNSSKLVQQ